jgi:lipoyl(octanoyl) transferase
MRAVSDDGALVLKDLKCVPYADAFEAMRTFTQQRTEATPDELWVCSHPPVFTLGLAGDPSHLLAQSGIPLVNTDRGGQITYHGPGQIVLYPLLNLHRYGLKVREYVNLLEQALIDTLVELGVSDAQRKPSAPGVYTWRNGALAKIAALGIKVSRGCSYHGLALNVDMDLSPFQTINPCGYSGLETVDLRTVGVKISVEEVQVRLVNKLLHMLDRANPPESE